MDIEVAAVVPAVVCIHGWTVFWTLTGFLGILILGAAYEWHTGVQILAWLAFCLPVFRLGHEVLFWTFLADVALLTWVGAQPILPSTVLLGQCGSIFLLCYLGVLTPALGWLERAWVRCQSVHRELWLERHRLDHCF